MSHFYGTLKGSRGEASRCGTRNSGLETHAASWKGAIRVAVFTDDDGEDHFRVERVSWRGAGPYQLLAVGRFVDDAEEVARQTAQES